MGKSIFQELTNYIPKQNKKAIIEMRSSNAIYSLINILNLIRENYDEEDYNEIEKKVILSIKTKNPEKFLKKLKLLKLKDEKLKEKIILDQKQKKKVKENKKTQRIKNE